MSVAETARPRLRTGVRIGWWPAALGGLFFGSLILRLVGISTGLPFVYNADENAHFVPRAIGMFGHSLNPDYFINPPAYTYLLHVLYAVWWGGRDAVGSAFAADPTTAFAIARAASAACGVVAVALLALAGARMLASRA